jgi:hypothetical protein
MTVQGDEGRCRVPSIPHRPFALPCSTCSVKEEAPPGERQDLPFSSGNCSFVFLSLLAVPHQHV